MKCDTILCVAAKSAGSQTQNAQAVVILANGRFTGTQQAGL